MSFTLPMFYVSPSHVYTHAILTCKKTKGQSGHTLCPKVTWIVSQIIKNQGHYPPSPILLLLHDTAWWSAWTHDSEYLFSLSASATLWLCVGYWEDTPKQLSLNVAVEMLKPIIVLFPARFSLSPVDVLGHIVLYHGGGCPESCRMLSNMLTSSHQQQSLNVTNEMFLDLPHVSQGQNRSWWRITLLLCSPVRSGTTSG